VAVPAGNWRMLNTESKMIRSASGCPGWRQVKCQPDDRPSYGRRSIKGSRPEALALAVTAADYSI